MQTTKVLFLSVFFFFSGACQAWEWPRYWLCQGSNQQRVSIGNQDSKVFSGQDPVLLEVFQGKVFQFFAPPLAGAYVHCPSKADVLLFQANNCQPQSNQTSFRQGVLNRQSGKLIFTEYRLGKGFEASGTGEYQCQDIGNQYRFAPLNHANKKP
jgi:hypothetical protein